MKIYNPQCSNLLRDYRTNLCAKSLTNLCAASVYAEVLFCKKRVLKNFTKFIGEHL